MAYPNTPQNVAAITNADRRLLLLPTSSSLPSLSFGINPAANAAAVDGPPIAALDAVSNSSQVVHDDDQRAPRRLPRRAAAHVSATVATECTSRATDANAIAAGPPATADGRSAADPTAAKRRWKHASDRAGATSGIFPSVSSVILARVGGGGRCSRRRRERKTDRIDRSAISPNMARNAHMVPGGLNGGGNVSITLRSRRVAAATEARAMEDASAAAETVAPCQVEVSVAARLTPSPPYRPVDPEDRLDLLPSPSSSSSPPSEFSSSLRSSSES